VSASARMNSGTGDYHNGFPTVLNFYRLYSIGLRNLLALSRTGTDLTGSKLVVKKKVKSMKYMNAFCSINFLCPSRHLRCCGSFAHRLVGCQNCVFIIIALLSRLVFYRAACNADAV